MVNDSSISKRFTFPKAEHLKSRKAIEQLFNSGKSFMKPPYKVIYQIIPHINAQTNKPINSSPLQVGFAVSGRSFKRAVDRNRIKRLGREAYRLNKHELYETLKAKEMQMQVFFVFIGKTLPNFEEVEKAMKSILEKLIQSQK